VDVAKYAVSAVLVEGRSVRAVAASTGQSKSWVHRHVALYRSGGDEALVPRKRGPKAQPNQTAPDLEDEIVHVRKVLGETGFDAGARTIAYHLRSAGHQVPSNSTIHWVLTRRGFVTPQPQKRPRTSWQRFESQMPNDTWQSDMTHWQVTAGKVEIINFIDDYSRAVLCSAVVSVATSAEVVRLFYETAATWGLPASLAHREIARIP
jgi:transposase InsO family protein